MTVVRSEPPYLFVQIGSRGGMFSKGFLGKMMAISRRNDSAKASLPQIASANNSPPRSTIFLQGLPLAVGQAEGVAAVHEDDRVVEQGGVRACR